jgi:glycosyltransferase involved in cell wall biosynthesis
MKPVATVLIPTYNRKDLLGDAIVSVLKQDYGDFELVVLDDCSTDGTPEYMETWRSDLRVKYIRAKENVGSVHGDAVIYRRFLAEYPVGEFFVFLGDDDYWLPSDLLSRQVGIMREHKSCVMAWGGVAQKYPHFTRCYAANQPYIENQYVGYDEDTIFPAHLFPHGLIDRLEFLRLFAADPSNRNIVLNAALYRTSVLREAKLLDRISGWQAGYALICGMAMRGNIYFIDEPCMINRLDSESASFRGTQLAHYKQCLESIDVGFSEGLSDPELKKLRDQTAVSVTWAYLGNKIANKQGAFRNNPLGDISHIMIPEISSDEFFAALAKHDVPLTAGQRRAIEMSDLSLAEMA